MSEFFWLPRLPDFPVRQCLDVYLPPPQPLLTQLVEFQFISLNTPRCKKWQKCKLLVEILPFGPVVTWAISPYHSPTTHTQTKHACKS